MSASPNWNRIWEERRKRYAKELLTKARAWITENSRKTEYLGIIHVMEGNAPMRNQ
jgi:hypothetical protein